MAEVNTAELHQFPIKIKMECELCHASGVGSCRCGAPYRPVSAGERAEAAVKANPRMSDRAIAEEIGVGKNTVARARKATGPCGPVDKRTGRDGKARKTPKPRGSGKMAAKYKMTRAAIREPVSTGTLNTKDAARKLGVSVDTVERAALGEQARVEVLAEFSMNPENDPATFSLSAKAKLEVAKRIMERKLNAEHAARMRDIDEVVRQRVLSETKEYLAMLRAREEEADNIVAAYKVAHLEFINDHKPPFAADEFKTILMCLHPDGLRTADKLSEAFRLFNSKKFQLTGLKN